MDKWAGTGVAEFKCNVCKKFVSRDLGWKLWTPSYCDKTGKGARLYRISAPRKTESRNGTDCMAD